ncbi:uncharacterized protein OCT59_029278 [Rhizophagus irregularis]|uniref:Membrane anchor Opy2 N-terminal domain-containing protein n=3 Tax=Rhizophagus irregularis TaxID=588596 RepID=U9SUE1_RHIID|nr:hypothetical protein GLOIN_2v1655270 [Rhizophagus irregularis DAOM 181602=DAOM 197198]POG66647.1 hypothetical protein GLOIN_2v1655270 [Rhizophagus irregularis DAOM 181602=DAOM 197198]UZO09039.1 hypothetical protein OCT59_029278 [Rhizophagus irregularis]GBC40828.2 hypothetical protein GLOIN_2v1655270 [Rhizophagus irregularis DAOM 181602=DAOM 197198]CAB5198819.1 unnamed protein product [Rhizophagus irregularis]|eukprot:XP_025173513.1 hypothetical protein GLOIN_2v1655270 [Rhizophagus irregularis DAOM 181602=DAOM 197198]
MFSISKIKLYMLVWLVCITIIFINITPVTAQENKGSSSCIPCDVVPTCPPCGKDSKCTLSLRTCFQCPQASCSKSSSDLVDNNNNSNNQGNKILLPAVIGGILGVGFLTAIGYVSFVRRRKARNNRGIKLDSNEEMTSLNGENVIPIAYIPSTTPTTPTTPIPEPSYLRIRVSNVSAGTTPLASPLPRNLLDEQLIDITDDDDTAPDIGTILQATKTSPAASTATLVTATRAKPALVRLNTIKQATNKEMSSTQSTRSENSIPSTPKTPMKNTFLYAPSISSVPSSPTSLRIGGDSDTEQMMPHIDIERPSAESFRVTNPNQNTTSQNQNLNSAALDPIEGRQSFGLFGSDEVYSNDPSSPQLHRESIISSSSSNGRSTMFSDDGDGEIMIFWGGNTPSFVNVAGGEVKEPGNNVDSTKKGQNEEIKTKESI